MNYATISHRTLRLVTGLLAGLVLATAAAAQTPVLEVGTPERIMQVNKDAGLFVKGTYGTGTIPATGAGVRLMWHPAKAAFRAGAVSGASWDEANIGAYSVAMGSNTARKCWRDLIRR